MPLTLPEGRSFHHSPSPLTSVKAMPTAPLDSCAIEMYDVVADVVYVCVSSATGGFQSLAWISTANQGKLAGEGGGEVTRR